MSAKEKQKDNNSAPRAAIGKPGILTGEEIRSLKLIDELNDNPTYLKATSYDLTLGSEVYICGKGEPKLINLGNGADTVTIESLGTIIFSTKEKIKLGKYTNIVGHFGLRIEYGLKGFILQVGPQIEPGYDGPLFGALLNTRNERQFIPRGARFLTVEFYRSETSASIGPTGKFKSKTIDNLREFLMAQHIEDSTLVIPSLVQQIQKDFDDCREKHDIKSKKEDRIIAKKGVLWKKIAVCVTIIIAVVGWTILIINWLRKDDNSGTPRKDGLTGGLQQLDGSTKNRQEPVLQTKSPIEPEILKQEQKKDSDPNIGSVINEHFLIEKPVSESNGLRIEQINASDPNVRSIRKDHNEP